MRKVLATLVVLAACAAPQAAPEGVLPHERFVLLLTEAQLIEARVNRDLVLGPQVPAMADSFYMALFREQGVTREQFITTFDHYAARPEAMKAIYEEVITELGRRKDRP